MRKHSPTQADSGKIMRWLKSFGMVVTEEIHPKTVWVLVAKEAPLQVEANLEGEASPTDIQEATWGCAIARLIGKDDRLIVQAAYQIEPHYRREFDSLEDEQRREFLWDIRMNLIRFNAGFEGIGDPLVMANFTKVVFNEALSRTSLHDAIVSVKNPYVWLGWRLAQRFSGAMPPPSVGSTFRVN